MSAYVATNLKHCATKLSRIKCTLIQLHRVYRTLQSLALKPQPKELPRHMHSREQHPSAALALLSQHYTDPWAFQEAAYPATHFPSILLRQLLERSAFLSNFVFLLRL